MSAQEALNEMLPRLCKIAFYNAESHKLVLPKSLMQEHDLTFIDDWFDSIVKDIRAMVLYKHALGPFVGVWPQCIDDHEITLSFDQCAGNVDDWPYIDIDEQRNLVDNRLPKHHVIICDRNTRINSAAEIVQKLEPGSEYRLLASKYFANEQRPHPLQFTTVENLEAALILWCSCFHALHVWPSDNHPMTEQLETLCNHMADKYECTIVVHANTMESL